MTLSHSLRLKGVFAANVAVCSLRNYHGSHIASSTARPQSTERLRILFCGSEEFSAFSLKALSEYARSTESNIASIDVVTRKDKRVGRGLKLVRAPFIKSLAHELKLPLHQIDTFTKWSPPRYDNHGNPDSAINLVIAVSFGLLVPPRILRGAAYGGLNVHPSLLPRFKGAAPIHWTILHGLRTTGVSLQTLHESKFDEGVVLDRVSTPIENPDTCSFKQLRNQLGPVGAELLVNGLRERRYLSQGPAVKSSESEQPTYAPKIKKQHSAINPQLHGSGQILRMQRSFETLWAHAHDLDGNVLRILTSSVAADDISSTEYSTLVPEVLRPIAASVPVGVPYGMTSNGRQPAHADNAPLFMNTIDGLVVIHQLTVGGAQRGNALVSAAKGRLLEHYTQLESPSGDTWDIYKFCAPLRGEADGLAAIIPEAESVLTHKQR